MHVCRKRHLGSHRSLSILSRAFLRHFSPLPQPAFVDVTLSHLGLDGGLRGQFVGISFHCYSALQSTAGGTLLHGVIRGFAIVYPERCSYVPGYIV